MRSKNLARNRQMFRRTSSISVRALCVQFRLTLGLGKNIFPIVLSFEVVHDKTPMATLINIVLRAFRGKSVFSRTSDSFEPCLLVEFADKDVSWSNADHACAGSATACLFSKIAVFASTESSFFPSAFSLSSYRLMVSDQAIS